jgi:hypothetical protein
VFENVEKEADVTEKVEASKDRTSLQQEIECKSYWGSIFIKKFLNIVYAAQKHREIYAWLAPVDPETNYNSALETHAEGTGDWIFQTKIYKNWESNDNAYSGCMQNVSLFSRQNTPDSTKKIMHSWCWKDYNVVSSTISSTISIGLIDLAQR